MNDTTKVCSRCRMAKLLTEYHKQTGGTLDVQAYCKLCVSEVHKERYERNRSHNVQVSMQWKERNRARVAELTKEYKQRYPEKRRAHTAVSLEVRYSRWPPAATMVCEVCKEAQAAYWHHHLGYEREHWLVAIAVCTDCHAKEHSANTCQGDTLEYIEYQGETDWIRMGGAR